MNGKRATIARSRNKVKSCNLKEKPDQAGRPYLVMLKSDCPVSLLGECLITDPEPQGQPADRWACDWSDRVPVVQI